MVIKMNWKKLGKAILFPHFVIMIILVPVAAVFLVYSMVFLGTASVAAIISIEVPKTDRCSNILNA